MGAVVTLYTEQKVLASCFFLSYVKAMFVTACKLELMVLEGRARYNSTTAEEGYLQLSWKKRMERSSPPSKGEEN